MDTASDLVDSLFPLPPAELHRQWRLSEKSLAAPAGWRTERLGAWQLQSRPDALVSRLVDARGAVIGWAIQALGHLSAAGAMPGGGTIALDLADPDCLIQASRALYGRDDDGRTDGSGLIGPWTAILVGPDGSASRPRAFVGAAHSAVYSPAERCLASSHNLIPDVRRNAALATAVDPLRTRGFYGFGLTAGAGVHRLLPNHVLELETFSARRHWPVTGLTDRMPEAEAADRMIAQSERVLRLLSSSYDEFYHSLSAGRDSRAVLAMARPAIEGRRASISASTSRRNTIGSKIDAEIATRLAGIAKIAHSVNTVLPRPATDEGIVRAFLRIGEATAGPVLASAAAAEEESVNPSRLHLPGMAGETARAFYWQGRLPHAGDITPRALVRRTGMPLLPEVVAAAEAWLAALPSGIRSCPADVLDLLYVEQRLGCWEAPTRYLFPGQGRTTLNLMATTVAIEAMLRLPPEDRLAGTLQETIVQRAWPALSALPYNRAVGFQRVTLTLERALDLADRVAQRARREAYAFKARKRPARSRAGGSADGAPRRQ